MTYDLCQEPRVRYQWHEDIYEWFLAADFGHQSKTGGKVLIFKGVFLIHNRLK